MTIALDKGLRQVQYDNQEVFDGAVASAAPSVTYDTGSISASTDPFSGKTNKFAESKIVRVFCEDVCHVAWDSSAPTADTSDYPVPAGTPGFFVVAKGLEFMAVIPDAAANVFVTEVF